MWLDDGTGNSSGSRPKPLCLQILPGREASALRASDSVAHQLAPEFPQAIAQWLASCNEGVSQGHPALLKMGRDFGKTHFPLFLYPAGSLQPAIPGKDYDCGDEPR